MVASLLFVELTLVAIWGSNPSQPEQQPTQEYTPHLIPLPVSGRSAQSAPRQVMLCDRGNCTDKHRLLRDLRAMCADLRREIGPETTLIGKHGDIVVNDVTNDAICVQQAELFGDTTDRVMTNVYMRRNPVIKVKIWPFERLSFHPTISVTATHAVAWVLLETLCSTHLFHLVADTMLPTVYQMFVDVPPMARVLRRLERVAVLRTIRQRIHEVKNAKRVLKSRSSWQGM